MIQAIDRTSIDEVTAIELKALFLIFTPHTPS